MSHGHKDTRAIQRGFFSGDSVFQPDAGDHVLADIKDFGHLGIPYGLDFRICGYPFSHHFGGAEGIATMHEIDL